MDSWLKIYRKFVEWEWFGKPEMVQLYLFILLSANNKNKMWNGVQVKRGQLVTSIDTLHQKTGLSVQTLRTCLKRLKSTSEVTIKPTKRYTVITVCKYASYQKKENEYNKQNNRQTNKRLTNNQQTTNKQLTTTKEGKKERKNISIDIDMSENKFSDDSKNRKKEIDLKKVVGLYHSLCPSYSRIVELGDVRKQKIRTRLEEMNGDFKILESVFSAMESSKFLKGDNRIGWKASFDWLFANSTNWVKVAEGNYQDKGSGKHTEMAKNVNDIWEE